MTNEITHLYEKLAHTSKESGAKAIHTLSDTKSFVSVGFVYFAQLEKMGWYQRNMILDEAKEAIISQDFLLADGIALQLLVYRAFHPNISPFSLITRFKKYSKLSVPNLNGTDFVPYLLSILPKDDYRLILYGTSSPYINKATDYVRKTFGFETRYQNGFTPFNPELLSKDKRNILLVGLGSPKQELFVKNLKQALDKDINVLAISVGGLFDFWGGREKRAPRIIRSLSLEWLWRAITNPRKNLTKTLTSLKVFWYLFR